MTVLIALVWIAVVTSTALLLVAQRRALPPVAGPAPRLHDLSEAAFMAGGPGAVVDAALVSLLGDGRLVIGGPGIVHVRSGARAGDTAERAVLLALRQAPSGWLYRIRYDAMLDPAVQEIGDALAARGLVSEPGAGRGRRRWGKLQALLCALLAFASIPITVVSLALDAGPRIPFALAVLPALIAGLVMGVVCAKRAGRRITPTGRAALGEIRAQHVGNPAPHVQTALFGLRGLQDPYLRSHLVPAAREARLAAARTRTGGHRPHSSGASGSSDEFVAPVLWCASSDGGSGGGGGSGCGSGPGCGSSSGCGGGGGGGSSCSSSGSSCGSSSSSCGSSSSSSCGSSSS
ncbi:TIGR04222 domain-containing membrane protein [Streptomyces sp. NPDC054904]|uniref:TIGR04222 domain-containing membrane protein n=1 Tax=unclassified Streptomyces TaxID=2593676 RepID=UPI002481AD01|nr:TIGR04222 domain-containing membrane protein [Streptomyces sp. Isolate_45]MDA5286596.1 TIGR04222 domain-containing membrane protein [Streptomyces sp. Isolate_45]